ncbi:lytic transglycosylase domain-containing protein [Egicoccus halophilus]|uniref:Transglycosylase SLT domain-containing protein n=1 Tax=Egicoccus halophilus TaxID=1670830 RepID=A0A8J3EU95_9ACTN|nr:transglycosylase SLT domain-containing protein [Egicoccus halophilus]GGI06699.1 hypothetical protein GCM10011354_20400 [Egicoccus halophilus]
MMTLGASGMVDAQARIAAIQGRIQSFQPSTPVLAATASRPSGAGGASNTAARTPSFPAELAASSATPLVGPPAGASTSTPGGTPVATAPDASGASGARTVPGAPAAAGTSAASGVSGTWVNRLPAAGRPWAGAIEQAANEVGLDPALLAALVRHESNFDPDARSRAGAIGLAQLMPGTAAGLRVDPHDPLDNLRGGARYLKQQLDRFGRPELALAAYNAGPNRVAQAGGIPRIQETQRYVERVTNTWEQWR